MDPADARGALIAAGLAVGSLDPILGGWASWTFDVDGQWIARFPRTVDSAAATVRELALLPELAQWVSFAIPEPAYRGTWDALPFFAYRRIVGRPMTAADASPELFDSLARMLATLHEFPVGRAADLLETGPVSSAWRSLFEDLWPAVEHDVLPCLEPMLADRVRAEFERFVESAHDVPCCLVHNDLGPEHILLSEASSLPVGIIDFESSWIGDPAVDLVPLVALFGAQHLDALTSGRELGPRLRERMWFYRWMGSVHTIIYGVRNGVDHELQHGIAELRRRIAAT
jgi:aminoglycoside phosphotransferase (APT) family kinase protein